MKTPLNILSLALAAAALTVLPACKAVPKDSSAPEPAPAVAEAPAEQGYTWFAKKGQRRGGKAEAAAPAANAAPVENAPALQRVIVTGYCSCPKCCGANATGLTATGSKAQRGTISADPAIFPFGTQLVQNSLLVWIWSNIKQESLLLSFPSFVFQRFRQTWMFIGSIGFKFI